MKLTQVQVGIQIQIILIIDGQRMNFNSIIRAILDDSILIDPIMQQDKTVGFDGHEVMAICVAQENKPYLWNGISLRLVRFNGEVYHQLQTGQDGVFCNRRKYYRQYVGMEGNVNDLSHSYSVIIKDVSLKGCSFVTSEELELGKSIVLSFSDNETNYVIRAVINRKMIVDETNKTVYGCEMRLENTKLEKYISERQRQEMQRRNTSASERKK